MSATAAARTLTERQSIEALRAGVPNRAAVQHLGTDQKAVETRFLESLSQVAGSRGDGKQQPGFMVEGGFGTGKSHLLEWLQHISLEQGFACSKVVISKETPLGDAHKLFRAAVDTLTLPDRVGGLPEAVEKVRRDSQAYADLYGLVQDPASRFDPLFQATLLLFERLHSDAQFVDRVVAFWGGDRINVADLKKQLRTIGQARPDVRARRVRDLALPRFRFVAQLLGAAGYTGWVLLLDEVELVARLSLTAREHSYSILAALSGHLKHTSVPGAFMVGAMTDDFTGEVFERRQDRTKIPQRWTERDPGYLAEIEAGMQFLASSGRRGLKIQAPDAGALQHAFGQVRDLYEAAYGWQPPAEVVADPVPKRSMRQHVRDWITRWDLLRLDPAYRADIEVQTVTVDLAERPDLEGSDEPDEEDERLPE
jgi:P-loop Domain of unknown function (DUF2791)